MRQLNSTFNAKSNAAYNNAVFNAGTISAMHPSLARLYEAAKSVTPPVSGKSAVAAWLNVSPQLVNNWENRGVSRAGAMAAQEKTGYSATWIRDGLGQKLLRAAPVKGAVFEALSSEEEELIQHFRHLLGKDRRAKLAEIAELAKERLAERDELFAQAGINAIAERAAHASRRRTASVSMEPGDRLKQQSLLDDDPTP